MEKCDVGSVNKQRKYVKEINKNCEICGKEFIAHTVRSKYCSEECKKAAIKKTAERFKEKQKTRLKEKELLCGKCKKDLYNNIVPSSEQSENIIFKKIDVKTGDVTTVRELAKSLGTVRFQIVEELKKLRSQLADIEKQKVLLDHHLESYKEVSEKILIENGLKRLELITIRREVKCKIQILDVLIRDMPENPDKFAYDMISHQEKLDDIYDRKKKWNIAEWNIRGVGRD